MEKIANKPDIFEERPSDIDNMQRVDSQYKVDIDQYNAAQLQMQQNFENPSGNDNEETK